MDNKDFVPFETARKLKAAGFDEPCRAHYTNDYVNDDPEDLSREVKFHFDWTSPYNYNQIAGNTSAQTLWQAAKWLREEKKIDIDITSDFVIDDNEIINRQYFFTVWDNYKGKQLAESFLKAGDTYEAALSVGIDAALDLIIKKTLGSL